MNETVNCSAAAAELCTQFSQAIAMAALNGLKGVITAANITKCFKETGEKMDKDVHSIERRWKQRRGLRPHDPTSSSKLPNPESKLALHPKLSHPSSPGSTRSSHSKPTRADEDNNNTTTGTPAATEGTSKSSKSKKTPEEKPAFVQFPSLYDDKVPFATSRELTVWEHAEKSSVLGRWADMD